MNVLLVEPDYYTRYPALGLLKLATYHRECGDQVQLVRGCAKVRFKPDRVLVTSLFTWQWQPVWTAIRYYKERYPKAHIVVGGIYASLLTDHARMSGADDVFEGTDERVEALVPDYSLVPEWKSSLLFASRGCPRKCGFCSVPKLEGAPIPNAGAIEPLIYPGHRKAVFFDNNILGVPTWKRVFEELSELDIEVDFNQGMDVRYIQDEAAELLSRMRIPIIRLAFDYKGVRPWVEKAIKALKGQGIRGRRIVFYVLHNYIDSPQDFFERTRDLLSWGVVVYPMRYEPLCTLQKHQYVSPGWTVEELQMVATARRVMGYGGAFPPYAPLVRKFETAAGFHDAFELVPLKSKLNPPEPIREMAMEHEQPSGSKKAFFPSWRRESDWRKVPTTSSPGR